jgi:hypothetical protein
MDRPLLDLPHDRVEKDHDLVAYPALIPNKGRWELLATEDPDEAKRQGWCSMVRTTRSR